VFLDESGVGFTPQVRRTWAPRGHTPVLRHRQRRWTRLSIAGMCCYRPDGTDARLAVHLQPGSYNDQVLIGVLGQLRRFLHGQKATLLWDGLPSHRSRVMQAFIASQRGWLVVERLPGYAPELNPVEGLWSQPEGPRACQLCRCHHRGAVSDGPAWGPAPPWAAVRLPRPYRAFAVTRACPQRGHSQVMAPARVTQAR
jgi:DDE superfamily endonuclease